MTKSIWRLCVFAPLLVVFGPARLSAQLVLERTIEAATAGEAVATMSAGCRGCDWGVAGREAVALKLSVDGTYSQHLLLTRGESAADYEMMLGHLSAGTHRLTIERDAQLSAKDAGEVLVKAVNVRIIDRRSPLYHSFASAPILHARPGSLERFSDVPLLMYVEQRPRDGLAYTVIFSHEDGGTPADRLMATWGRSTDIEYVYGVDARARGGEYQGRDHAILPFRGSRSGAHPLLWVATDNNMVSDTGPQDAVRFAPAPQLFQLTDVSREAVMDSNPWLYALSASELRREGRIDPDAPAGSGKVADPRTFVVLEACGDLQDATLAFDVGTTGPGGEMTWLPSDRAEPTFRIARSGCFRSAVRVPAGTTPDQIRGLRARAYTRPPRNGEKPLPSGRGRVTLKSVNPIFVMDQQFRPVRVKLAWGGRLRFAGESEAVAIPLTRP